MQVPLTMTGAAPCPCLQAGDIKFWVGQIILCSTARHRLGCSIGDFKILRYMFCKKTKNNMATVVSHTFLEEQGEGRAIQLVSICNPSARCHEILHIGPLNCAKLCNIRCHFVVDQSWKMIILHIFLLFCLEQQKRLQHDMFELIQLLLVLSVISLCFLSGKVKTQ